MEVTVVNVEVDVTVVLTGAGVMVTFMTSESKFHFKDGKGALEHVQGVEAFKTHLKTLS